jgi:hypothetical protein
MMACLREASWKGVPMSSTLSPTQSVSARGLPAELSEDSNTLRPADLRNNLLANKRSSIAPRTLARFLITFCIGVGATLAWQSHGDAARDMIASSFTRLSWLAPQTSLDMVAPVAPTADQQQLETISLDLAAVRQSVNELAAVRQSVDKLAAGQEQMTRETTKLQVTEQYILDKMSTSLPRLVPALAHKPVPRPSQAPLEPDVPSQRNPMGPLHGIGW